MKKMKQATLLIMLLFAFASNSHGQESESNFTDDYYSSIFETLYSVDTEMAYCIAPIVEERLVSKLADTSSFYNPFKKLSEYVSIKTSSDSLVKTYSWDRISGGSRHDNASYLQFKTKSGKIKYKRLDSGIEQETGEPTDVIIYDIHNIRIKDEFYYLLLGWGTHGGGRHHSLARVYKIKDEEIVLCDSFFDGEKYLHIGAPRVGRIDLQYNYETKELSHNYYEYDASVGFYKPTGNIRIWLLENDKFVLQK